MTNYVDLDELRKGVYFQSATLDDRFIWEEITPDVNVSQVTHGEWTDGFLRFRILDCAHREEDRDGALCTHCGYAFPAVKKTPAKKTSGK